MPSRLLESACQDLENSLLSLHTCNSEQIHGEGLAAELRAEADRQRVRRMENCIDKRIAIATRCRDAMVRVFGCLTCVVGTTKGQFDHMHSIEGRADYPTI